MLLTWKVKHCFCEYEVCFCEYIYWVVIRSTFLPVGDMTLGEPAAYSRTTVSNPHSDLTSTRVSSNVSI